MVSSLLRTLHGLQSHYKLILLDIFKACHGITPLPLPEINGRLEVSLTIYSTSSHNEAYGCVACTARPMDDLRRCCFKLTLSTQARTQLTGKLPLFNRQGSTIANACFKEAIRVTEGQGAGGSLPTPSHHTFLATSSGSCHSHCHRRTAVPGRLRPQANAGFWNVVVISAQYVQRQVIAHIRPTPWPPLPWRCRQPAPC
jgi:hypothetical protein